MKTSKCLECGQPLKPGEYFCGDQCWDRWQDGRNMTPGYTLIAADISRDPEQKRGKGRREKNLPPSNPFAEYRMPFDDLPF